MKMRALHISLILSFVMIITTCQNPLESGLGKKPDIQPPQLTVTSNSNGDYVKGPITVSGAASDDVKIETVQLSLDNRVTWVNATVDTGAKTWSYNIDTTELNPDLTRKYPDARYNVIIKATDAGNKETETGILLIFDNTPPLVLVKIPLEYQSPAKYNGFVSIKGETTDMFGITKVQIKVRKGDTVIKDWTVDEDKVLGSASWSYLLDSNALLLDATTKIEVRAIDYANNTSNYFFHYADVLAANASVPITIEQINTINDGGTVTNMTVTKTVLDAIRKSATPPMTLMTLDIDQNSDLPQFIISSPQDGDTIGASARVVGMVTDDDGVVASSIKINVDGTGWNLVEPKSSNGLSVNWEYTLPVLADSPPAHNLQLSAVDVITQTVVRYSDTITFNINTGAPSLDILTPAQGSFKSGNFTMTGTASHGTTIDLVEVSTDNGVTWENASQNPTWENWSYDVNTLLLLEGPHTIKVRVSSGTNTAIANLQVNIAKTLPTINFIIPSAGVSVNGTFNIQGTVSVSGATLESLSLKILNSNTTLTTSGTYFWSSNFNSTLYDEAPHAADLGGGRWQITLRATAMDSAGNIGTRDHVFIIDQSTDWPVPLLTFPASVTAPYEIVGANAVVRGTVTDDDGVNTSTVAISVDGAAYTTSGLSVVGSGTNVSFSYTMPIVSDGQHTVRVRANDTVASGLRESDLVTFIVDTLIPTFTSIVPSQGSYRNADFVVSGRTSDVNNINTVTVNVNGGGYVAADTLVQVTPGNDTVKDFTKTISTASGSGTYTINIRSTDATGKENIYTFDIIVDKTNPSVVFTNPAVANTHITGRLDLKGTSSDNNKVNSVTVRIPKSNTDLGATGTYNWLVSNFNTSTYTTVVYADDLGGGLWSLTLRATVTDAAGNVVSSDLVVILDPALNTPVITLTNINPAGTTILESSPKVLGYITDNNGVDTMEISLDGGPFVSMGDPLNALNAPFSYDVNLLGDGLHTLQVRAADINVPPVIKTMDTPVNFRIDRTAPTLVLSTPASNSQQRQNFNVTGTANDINGVTSVQVKVDAGVFQDASAAPNWSYTVNIGGLLDGAHTLTIQATDLSGKTTTMSRDFIRDTTGPTIAVTDPQSGTEQIGGVIVKGTSSDANAITLVELAIGKPLAYQPVTGIYNWSYIIDNIDIYADSGYADKISTDPDPAIWRLYLHIRATDTAGNVRLKDDYFVDVVPEKNKPEIEIVYPVDNQTLGGQLRIYGTAMSRKNSIDTVQMQVDYNADGDYEDAADFWDGSTPNTNTIMTDLWETESTWVTVTGTNNWSQLINTVGEFYSKTPGETHTIKFRIKATDNLGNTCSPVERTITFTNNVPTMENLQIEYSGKLVNYNAGLIVSKDIVIRGTIKDSHGVASIMLTRTIPSGGGTVDIKPDTGKITHELPVGGYDIYTLHLMVNTSDAALYLNSAGQLSYTLKLTNDAQPNPYITYVNLNLQVDNIYPTGAYAASSDVIGTAYKVQGTGADSGAVSGAEQIVVYMVRDESGTKYVYNPKLNNTRTILTTTKQLKEGAGAISDIIYPEPSSTTSVYRVSIDTALELGNDTGPGGDNDGYNESFTLAGSTYNWWAEFNSYNIPDGPIEVHYVVFDKGGNGTHYKLPNGFIKNNPPVISQVTLGTDINGDSSIAVGERQPFSTGYSATNFTARNSMLLFNITASGGNGTLRYSVRYNSIERNGTLTNNEFTITDFTTNPIPDASGNGASFTVRVYDSTAGGSLEQIITVNMNIANTDTIAPTITLTALATTDATSDPTTGGHIELAGESLYDTNDPDVSGTVTLRGHAHDDQRVKNLKMTITNFNLGAGVGIEATLAAWPQTNTNGTYGSLTISNVSLTQSGGHDFDWAYTWNTANVTNQAGKNISVTVKAEDFRLVPGPNTATTTPRTHDVVPYIRSIDNVPAQGVPTDVIRSSTGKYSIDWDVNTDTTNYFTVHGYNLNGPRNIWISAAVITSPGGLDISTNVTGTPTQYDVQIRKEIGTPVTNARSGYITVFINGEPTLNNINDNTKAYNIEKEVNKPQTEQWNDDRYLWVWSTTQVLPAITNQTYHYSDMIMNGSQPVFSYCDDILGSTNITTSDTAFLQRSQYRFQRQATIGYADGTYFIITGQDTTRGGETDIGYLELTGNNGTTMYEPSYGASRNWIEIQGEDYGTRETNRFPYPKMIAETSGTDANIFIAYYDTNPTYKSLQFISFKATGRNTTNAGFTQAAADDQRASPLSVITGTTGTSSQYFDMVKIGATGIAIVYYDSASQTLKMAYRTDAYSATTNLTTTTGSWSTITVDSSTFTGQHVSMVTDGTKLYMAYLDSGDANLKFARVSWNAGAPTVDGIVYIDKYLSVGSWTNVQLIGGQPYISYYSDSYNGTRKPIRITKPNFDATTGSLLHGVTGSGANENFSGSWEIMTVPTISNPKGGMEQFSHTQLGMYTNNTQNLPVVGWLADRLEYSKLQPNN